MNEQYLVDSDGNRIGVVIDIETYQKLLEARQELDKLRQEQRSIRAQETLTPSRSDLEQGQFSIRELRGLGKSIWSNVEAQSYVRNERDSWAEIDGESYQQQESD